MADVDLCFILFIIGMMGATLVLLLISHFNMHHLNMCNGQIINPEFDEKNEKNFLEIEGARYLATQQSSNTVPMIGKKASTKSTSSQTKAQRVMMPVLYPYLIKFLDLGLSSSNQAIGKRSGIPDMKTWAWLQKHIGAKLQKRGFPSFSVPDSWKSKSKSSSRSQSLSKLRNDLYGDRHKKSDISMSLFPRRDSQWFRFHNGDFNPYRRAMIYKRADSHMKDFNSVPFMGKRSEEKGDAGVKSGEGVLVRRPRYLIEGYDEEVDQDGFNPWAFFDLEAQIQNELI